MHGLLPAQWPAALASGDHGVCAPGECGAAQPPEAARARSIPLAPGKPCGRLGLPGQSPRTGGERPFCYAPAGIAAAVSRPAYSAGARGGIMKFVALGMIRFYQACLSPAMPLACRYYPSCSAYAYEAVEKWGARRGARLALGRLLRCRPWGSFGHDPVP